MDLHHPFVESVALPLLLSLALTGIARGFVGAARGGLAAVIGVGGAVIAATTWMSGLSPAPTSTLSRLPWTFVAAIVAGWIAAVAGRRPAVGWLVAAAVAIAALGWLGGVRGAINGAIGSLLLAALMRAPADRADAAAALVIASLGLAAATMRAGSLALFQQALLLAAATGGAALWLWPKPRLAFGPGATVAATVCWLATAQAASQSVAIAPLTLGLLAAALLATIVTGGRHAGAVHGDRWGLGVAARAGRAALLRPLATAAIAGIIVAAAVGWQFYGGAAGPPAATDGAKPAAEDPYLK